MSKYTLKLHKKVIDDYKSYGCNVIAACEANNISDQTFNNWLKKHPQFKADKESADFRLVNIVSSRIITDITSKTGDLKWCAWFLERKGKKDGWSLKDDDQDYKLKYYQLMLMFMYYIQSQIKDDQLFDLVSNIQRQFLDIVQASASPEHLELMIKQLQITSGTKEKDFPELI